MPDRQTNLPSKVTLEDLLRLKRAERPAPEFWAEFERELRQKQLAALVARRSWWHELSAVYRRFGRLRLPLGAAAVVALSFVSLRYYSAPRGDPSLAVDGYPLHLPTDMTPAHPLAAEKPVVPAALAHLGATDEPARAGTVASTAVVTESPRGRAKDVVTPTSWPEEFGENHSSPANLTPSARSIAVNLAAVVVTEPELVDSVARPLGFEERAMPAARARHTAEILPTAAAVTEPRRAHLLASLGSAGIYAPEPSAPEHAKRSVLRYLAEAGWDRSMSRLEAEGDKLSIKF
jgi:hypothetical protein